MKKVFIFMVVASALNFLSCATTKNGEKWQYQTGEGTKKVTEGKKEPLKSGILGKKFARLVKDTEADLNKGTKSPDKEGIREFYGTYLEENAMYLMAASFEYAGDFTTALTAYKDLVDKYPDSEEGYAGIIHIFLENNQIEAAVDTSEAVSSRNMEVQSSRLLSELVSLSLLKRDTESAEKYLKMAKESGVNEDIYLYNMAIVKLLQGKSEEGEALLKKNSSRFKNTAFYGLLSGELTGKRYENNRTKGELSHNLKSSILNHSAIMAIEAGEREKARTLLARSEDEKLAGAETFTLIGNVLFEKGLFKESAENYKKAIAMNPFLPEAHLNLGIVSEIFLDDFDLARSSYTKYIELGGERMVEVKKWLKNLDLRIK